MTEEQNGQSPEGQEQVDLNVEATQEAPQEEAPAPQGPPPIADLPEELQRELEALSPEERQARHNAMGPDGQPA